MDIKPLSNKLSLSEQLRLVDIGAPAEKGYRSVVCNSPDGKGADQRTFDEIKAEAEPLGLMAPYLTFSLGQINDDEVTEFSQAIRELPEPAIAYCCTGTRSATRWLLSFMAKAAGDNMSGVARRLTNCGELLPGFPSWLIDGSKPTRAALTLAGLSGVILLVMGAFKLGFLTNFLLHPVIAGFITASGILIATSQLKHVLGVMPPGTTW